MNVRPDVINEVRRWVEKADHDLAYAEYVVTMVPPETGGQAGDKGKEKKHFKNDERCVY
jgi:hypothetical protein